MKSFVRQIEKVTKDRLHGLKSLIMLKSKKNKTKKVEEEKENNG